MPNLIVVTRASEEHLLTGDTGLSVMEIMRDGGIDEVLALCGGCCSCATCHVHVDSAFAERLSPMSPNENDLLESSGDRGATSRLSCQIVFSDAIDGLRVQAPGRIERNFAPWRSVGSRKDE